MFSCFCRLNWQFAQIAKSVDTYVSIQVYRFGKIVRRTLRKSNKYTALGSGVHACYRTVCTLPVRCTLGELQSCKQYLKMFCFISGVLQEDAEKLRKELQNGR